jgi:hypothetical protein
MRTAGAGKNLTDLAVVAKVNAPLEGSMVDAAVATPTRATALTKIVGCCSAIDDPFKAQFGARSLS